MTLMRNEHIIVSTQYTENLFILNRRKDDTFIIVQDFLKQEEWYNFLCTFTEKLQLWHCWFAYVSVVWFKCIN